MKEKGSEKNKERKKKETWKRNDATWLTPECTVHDQNMSALWNYNQNPSPMKKLNRAKF